MSINGRKKRPTWIPVVAGIIAKEGKVLLGERPEGSSLAGVWEFPGGKLEAGELPEQALIREFREEVGIIISSSEKFMMVKHDYPDRLVTLYVQLIHDHQGEITPMEGQALKWVELEDLGSIDFLKGNQVIVKALLERKAKAD